VELHLDSVVPSGGDGSHHARHSHSLHSPEEKLATASGAPRTSGLFCTHFSALLTKRAIYAKRDRRMIFCQLVLPVLLVLLGVAILLVKPNLNQPNMVLSAGKFNPDLGSAYRNFVPFSIDGAAADSIPAQMQARFNGDQDEGVYGMAVPIADLGGGDEFDGCSQGAAPLYNMSQYVLKSVDSSTVDHERGSSRYGAVTIAANTDEAHLNYNVLVNGSAVHGVGVFVNLVHQAFLQVISDNPAASIKARNYPLPETYKQKNDAATADAFVVALFAMIAFCFVPASFAVFVVKEREVKAKHQQVISGVSIYAYWTSTYLWDTLSYLPTATLVILLVYVFSVSAYTQGSSASAFALLLLLYGPATAAITYLLSFMFVRYALLLECVNPFSLCKPHCSPLLCSHSTAQIAVMFFNFITGLCLVIVSFVLTTIPSTTEINLSLRYLFRLFPSFCMGDGIIQLALCTDGTSCPVINSNGYNFDATQGPLAWDIAGADLAFLACHALVYFAFAVLIGEFMRSTL
jgi:ATP-binding cassette subfamily A (ABC1) protein 3